MVNLYSRITGAIESERIRVKSHANYLFYLEIVGKLPVSPIGNFLPIAMMELTYNYCVEIHLGLPCRDSLNCEKAA